MDVRAKRKLGILSAERIDALDALGLVWDAQRDAFDRGLADLAAYVQTHRHARVPTHYLAASGFKLGRWCGHQRRARRDHKLSAERVAELDALGFVWHLHNAFDLGLDELVTYIEANGNARVPTGHSTPGGFNLGKLCSNRRYDRRAGKLNAERVAALDALGFVWDARQVGSHWESRRGG
jgi:hypothetical protein